MIFKLLIGIAVVIALVRMVMPGRPSAARVGRARDRILGKGRAKTRGDATASEAEPPRRVPRADDLERCAGCGIWLPRGQSCDCETRA